ncbi:hypothetical protein LUZ62_060759 [Rhynchospora pubera]|uniref:Uncharacterized protein n=1 Tax=Rhynchospora pubera TaxID=906938 RepID=A0AAV8ECI9_9POAL|nr:hypothetical protein LUZ62_059620 [Rhynchospora pubera]KAJ4776502.1 hypothetical protein LUZ62_060759 [Rhynchospora pubera]
MAFNTKFLLAFLLAVVAIDGSIAARHLLDTTAAPEAAPTTPKPTIPAIPTVPSTIPGIPTTIPTALPPMPTIPTAIPAIPKVPTTLPPIPAVTAIPSIPTTIPTTLPPIPATIPGFQIPSIPYLSQPPATPSP